MQTEVRALIRPIVRGAYDQQKLRIQTGNRLASNFRAKLGQRPGKLETEELSADAQDVIAMLKASYRLLGTAIAEYTKRKPRHGALGPIAFVGDELIETYTELALVEQYLDLEEQERRTFKRLETALASVPIYTEYLSHVRGIGPALAAVIVSEIDISRARHVSSIWKYAGLDVAEDGAGRSRRGEHLIERAYLDRNGKEALRKSITFNPFLKTKLLGVLASSFLRAGNERYREIYDSYKHRLESHPVHAEKSKGHRHNMAMRYMVKMFLLDLYLLWRPLEGLEVSEPYSQAKLGILHGGPHETSNPCHASVPHLRSSPNRTSEPMDASNPSAASEPYKQSQTTGT
jgi:hypothetical protein